jgi:phage N-6-adenine-methyltransferase
LETPQWLFDALDQEFHFTMDVCATSENTKCQEYLSPELNGLKQQWAGVCWMNPPYGDEIAAWIKKAYDAALAGVTVVALVPVRSSNEWWQWVIAGEVRFIRKKVQFVGAPYNSMFPNAIVVFRPGLAGGNRMTIWRRP